MSHHLNMVEETMPGPGGWTMSQAQIHRRNDRDWDPRRHFNKKMRARGLYDLLSTYRWGKFDESISSEERNEYAEREKAMNSYIAMVQQEGSKLIQDYWTTFQPIRLFSCNKQAMRKANADAKRTFEREVDQLLDKPLPETVTRQVANPSISLHNGVRKWRFER